MNGDHNQSINQSKIQDNGVTSFCSPSPSNIFIIQYNMYIGTIKMYVSSSLLQPDRMAIFLSYGHTFDKLDGIRVEVRSWGVILDTTHT